MVSKTMEELASLCKRRGFIFQSNDIYGGVKGLYDYGPMGVELKIIWSNRGGNQWFMKEMTLRV